MPVRPRDPTRAAWLTSAVLSPTLVLAVLFPLVGGLAAGWPAGASWGLLGAVFTAAVPAAVVHVGVRGGRLTDHHLSQRDQRVVPLATAVLSVTVGLVVLSALGAPRAVVALTAAVLATLIVATLVTLAWKISVHTAVVALTAAALTAVGHGWWALAWALVPAAAWARLQLAAHTEAQVVAGSVLGGGVTIPMMLVLLG